MNFDLTTLRRVIRKPPSVIIRRLAQETAAHIDRLDAGRRARAFDEAALLRTTGAMSLKGLWDRLAKRQFPFTTKPIAPAKYETLCPDDADRIFSLANRANAHEVDLLGSGPVQLGPTIDWLTDHKTGHTWPRGFMRDIEYNNLDKNSDVKFPWELSRLQWLIPVGQAYLLTGDDRYACTVRDAIDHWIAENPYALTVNWSCTMEAALRIVTWSWFFHVFSQSESWSDEGFRGRFLRALFLHGRFTAKYLEHSDVNGNHCTADAAGLVFAGLFFGQGSEPARWLKLGWDLLNVEIFRQVTPDGVDYEGSTAYHRLVMELFLLPAMYREKAGLVTPAPYRQRIGSMARFVAAYSRGDGSTPLLGDADDARMLPFGGQQLTDHRYLIGLAAVSIDETLAPLFSGPASEIFWTCGEGATTCLATTQTTQFESVAFEHGGYYVMRNVSDDHVFIDCAPVGLAGRGGHGHSDCLSFEAMLDGVLIVSDCGSYVYTASAAERNYFRSTDAHNTPKIDGAEMNRFVAPDNLWQLQPDAVPQVHEWRTSKACDVFTGSHWGYSRLEPAIRPVRTIELDHMRHAIRVHDRFEGEGLHNIEIPLHFALGIEVKSRDLMCVRLAGPKNKFFKLWWEGPNWTLAVEDSRVSPSYGVALGSSRLVWRGRIGPSDALTVWIAPETDSAALPAEPK